MRHLVYRVQPLSQSLLPLVWDFGTLRSRSTKKDSTQSKGDVEGAYIRQMMVKFVSFTVHLGLLWLVTFLYSITSCGQCRFVTLSNQTSADRCLTIYQFRIASVTAIIIALTNVKSSVQVSKRTVNALSLRLHT